jgi:hypothetical protein
MEPTRAPGSRSIGVSEPSRMRTSVFWMMCARYLRKKCHMVSMRMTRNQRGGGVGNPSVTLDQSI